MLGLGVGTIAAYAEPGERFTFYEIDPAVERIARNTDYFTYLADCRGKPEVILGDARLSLEHEPPRKFDLLIVDVFSSDSVPVHLMTREALKIYVDRLNPRGLLAFHISSRYLDLEPMLGSLAEDAGLTARLWRDVDAAGAVGRFVSVWVVMARSPADLGPLLGDSRWQPLACDTGPVWTDDFSNVAGTLRWKTYGLHWIPWKWQKSNQAEDHASLAAALLGEGRMDEAIEHLQKSVEIEPLSASNQFSLGRLLASRERTDEAIEHLQEAVSLDPDFAVAHSNLGIALDRKGRKDEALEHFRLAVEVAPDYVEGLRNLGKALLDRRSMKRASPLIARQLPSSPAARRYDSISAWPWSSGGKSTRPWENCGRHCRWLTKRRTPRWSRRSRPRSDRCQAWPWDEEKPK